MIIVKKQRPEFYDCRCDKCQAEFLYQLDDLKEDELDLQYNENPVLSMIMPKLNRYVICPCCGNKITTVHNLPGFGFGIS